MSHVDFSPVSRGFLFLTKNFVLFLKRNIKEYIFSKIKTQNRGIKYENKIIYLNCVSFSIVCIRTFPLLEIPWLYERVYAEGMVFIKPAVHKLKHFS